MEIKRKLGTTSLNLFGKRINRKILIFESDDWGSIRISSKSSLNYLDQKGISLKHNQYSSLDGLESNDDVDLLGMLLLSKSNGRQNKVKFTLNTVMSNPDFEKISNDQFQKYSFEEFSKTYSNTNNSENVLIKIKKGVSEGVFKPQFHSREHLNIKLWMRLLKEGDSNFLLAFNHRIASLPPNYTQSFKKDISATYDLQDSDYVESSIVEGLEIFIKSFDFHSKTFIPNNYVWNPSWNKYLVANQVELIQGMKYFLIPKIDGELNRKKLRNHQGKVISNGLLSTVRNCTFEPLNRDYCFERTLWEINNAFLFNKPAVISSHRVNFTSRISERTRDYNLKELEKLIECIYNKWPDVIFMSSDEYCDYLKNG